jgi:oligopeptide/dipeptide ABC transporter ATP-binding protein
MTADVIAIRDLSVNFATGRGIVHALRSVSFPVPRGQTVGLVGESGSGKSTLALAVMGLLPANASITSGHIEFNGSDLLALPPRAWRDIRGNRMAMVFQDPMTSLNPVRTIGAQMNDIQFRDTRASTAEKRKRAIAALRQAGIPDAAAQLDRYPFQFSGGMRQRIAIAMGLLQKPELLIADEVTTALDATLEAQILHLLRGLREAFDGSILFISHNLGAVAEICDRVVVLYAGEVVEMGLVDDIYHHPRHPYTQALLACDPARIETPAGELPVIPGEVPDLLQPPNGCVFAPRCPCVFDRCRTQHPRLHAEQRSHHTRCHLVEAGPA